MLVILFKPFAQCIVLQFIIECCLSAQCGPGSSISVVLHLAIPCFLLEQSDDLSIFLWNRRLANQVLTAEQIFPSLGLDSHFLQLALYQVVHPSTLRHFQNP